jgi:hypothetical protein
MFPRAYQRQIQSPLLILKRLPRPFGENPWVDVGYVAAIAIFQMAILPTILPRDMVSDLLTPWMAVAVVLLPASRSLPLIVLSALLIETRSAAPAGLYLTAYWMLGTAVTLSRNVISWTNRAPWLSLVIFSETWMFTAEFLVAFLAGQEPPIDFRFYIFQAFRIAISSYFGFFLAMKLAPDIRKGKPVDG